MLFDMIIKAINERKKQSELKMIKMDKEKQELRIM